MREEGRVLLALGCSRLEQNERHTRSIRPRVRSSQIRLRAGC